MKIIAAPLPCKPALLAIACGTALLLLAACENATTAATASEPAKVSVGTTIDDTVVTSRVKSALLADPDVKSFELKVETRGGEVMLSGFIGSQAQVDRAMSIARGVEGVKAVTNKMDLKDGATTVGNSVDDGIVTAKVKSALLADPGIRSFDIAVVTRKGEAQLSGFVDSQTQIDHATGLARAVQGVTSVANGMSIKK